MNATRINDDNTGMFQNVIESISLLAITRIEVRERNHQGNIEVKEW
jgi:hypothetical protein